MTKPYDQTFKLLAEHYGRELLLWLGQIAPEDVVIPLEREIDLPAQFVDHLFEVHHQGTRFLIHLESQTRYAANVPERMLWYMVRLAEKYRLPIHSVLLVLTPEDAPATIPTRHQWAAGGVRLEVGYTVVKLWEVDYREVFERGWTGLVTLVPLMKMERDEVPDVLRRCVDQAARVEDEALRRDLLTHLVVLGGLQFSRKQLLDLIGRIGMVVPLEKLRESQAIQMWIEEGVQRGVQQGMEQGMQQGVQQGQREALQEALLALARKRFGNLSAEVETRIRALDDVDQLNQLLLALVEMADVAELERQLPRADH